MDDVDILMIEVMMYEEVNSPEITNFSEYLWMDDADYQPIVGRLHR